MKQNRMVERVVSGWLLLGVLMLLPLSTVFAGEATPGEAITEEGIISGTMNIDFGTRTQLDTTGKLAEGSPAEGAKDVYTFALGVAKTTEFSGNITRMPRLFSKILGREKQPAELQYDITLSLRNPANLEQKKSVGKWVGNVPLDAKGVYQLDGGGVKGSPLRIAVDTMGSAQGFTESFAGKLVGKSSEKKGLLPYTFKRIIAGKELKIEVKQSDPLRFDNIVLAPGPARSYPRTTVNGRLDYDYETGNWYSDGIRFKYSMEGKDFEDVISGSIKWVEDPNREQNGKGQYEFNLRFNEEKNKSTTGESAAFSAGKSDEEAFFAVDNAMPSMTGTIAYVDTMIPGKSAPASSKITYKLNANKLTKQQVVNFFKLWLVCIGPTNDE